MNDELEPKLYFSAGGDGEGLLPLPAQALRHIQRSVEPAEQPLQAQLSQGPLQVSRVERTKYIGTFQNQSYSTEIQPPYSKFSASTVTYLSWDSIKEENCLAN
jgi:hypothetical protein